MRASTLYKRIGLVLLTLVGIGLATSLALAGKPGSGAIPPGKVFYQWGSEFGAGGSPPYYESYGFWSMNADGSGKQLTYRPSNSYDLSHLMHQGAPLVGDPEFVVLLVDVTALPGDSYLTRARWAKDDSFIAFGVVDASIDLNEIWAATIEFNETTGLPELAVAPMPIVSEGTTYIGLYDFAPSGDAVVYEFRPDNSSPSMIVVNDLLTGQSWPISADGHNPVWSPDGQRIAYLYIVSPDGTNARLLTNNTASVPFGWSPDSQHVGFSRTWWKNGPVGSIYFSDVYRISVTGGGAVGLTKDIDGFAYGACWR